jgi:hypothetical protein
MGVYSQATQSSLAALRFAIDSQDWESATRHCSRAMALPPDVIDGEFARATVVRTFPSSKITQNFKQRG